MSQTIKKKRRGIVILVVLSLLVLFVLLGVTFAIVASQYRLAAEMQSRAEQLSEDPGRLLDRAMYQLVRDTNNPASVIRTSSLLRDMYGNDGFAAYVGNAAALPNTSNQFLEISINTALGAISTDGITLDLVNANTTATTLSRTDGSYGGCLLTFTTGPAKGLSTRIVDYHYEYDSANSLHIYRLRLMQLRPREGGYITPTNLVGHRFVVNGRPFNGTGMGFDSGTNAISGALPTGRLDVAEAIFNTATVGFDAPVALLPNYSITNEIAGENAAAGGLDESYDAPNEQNMFMAFVSPGAASSGDVVPSFHRPELVNYWVNHATASAIWNQTNATGQLTTTARQLRRRVILRPLGGTGSDHPNFDGSNANFNPITGPWDVDNDGDGVPDSIWVDLGLPVVTAPDGRRYKPLFAILCTDLDGRLNVNAHGSPAWLSPLQPTDNTNLAGGASTAALPKGLGYGPPEINLAAFFGAANYTALVASRQGGSYPGANGVDLLTALRMFDTPANYFGGGAISSYRSPPDPHGELAVGINMLGQPQHSQKIVTDIRADVPYELDLSRQRSGGSPFTGNAALVETDQPFTVGDLERVLRYHDADTLHLPDRLTQLSTLSTDTNRRLVTTDSFDVPSTSAVVIRDPASGTNPVPVQAGSMVQWLRDRLNRVSPVLQVPNGALTSAQEAVVSAEIRRLLPAEMLRGLPMDINRPFGNGIDDTIAGNLGSGVVDEPEEVLIPSVEKNFPGASYTPFVNIPMSHTNGQDANNDGVFNSSVDSLLARQLYARHLYVLALMMMDKGDGSTPNSTFARQVAQWAINAVDFRDADSIMTPFEFDPNPFDGWDANGMPNDVEGFPDGYLGMSRSAAMASLDNLVWGCERPELLLTETFAFHSRRTEDTAADSTGKKTTDAMTTDGDFDQAYLPRSGTFIELYNPWIGTDTSFAPPHEFYVGTDGVQLSATTSGGSPVWRIVVQQPAPAVFTDPYRSLGTVFDKAVYFIPLASGTAAAAAGTLPADANRRYFTSLPVARIRPGYYAVVGSGGIVESGQRVTRIADVNPGLLMNPPMPSDYRRIGLVPNLDPTLSNVYVYQGGGQPAAVLPQEAVAISMDQSDLDLGDVNAGTAKFALNFSVSEPNDGYPNFTAAFPGPGGEVYDSMLEKYDPVPFNTPFDKVLPNVGAAPYAADAYFNNGTKDSFCRIYLQRLANPLENWHVTGNPYLTIDTMPVDLVAFNGLLSFGDAEGDVGGAGFVNFLTLQRGENGPGPTSLDGRRLWKREPGRGAPTANTATEATPVHYFSYELDHTLGNLNQRYTAAGGSAFPWLVFNNRPFVSQYELTQVPAYDSFELLDKVSFPGNGTPLPYTDSPPQFGHLLNFFQFTDGSSGQLEDAAKHLYRLMTFTRVPSRFLGSETLLSPAAFQIGGGSTVRYGTEGFLPPFNYVSEYRNPGLVNANTIASDSVWTPIRNDSGEGNFTFDQLVSSRRGYGGSSSTILSASSNVPTMFANVYRGPFDGSLVPLAGMAQQDVDATFLRRVPDASNSAPAATGGPMFESNYTVPYADVRRNSYFRYRPLHRIGNMLTTRSNVYAVWITVGYFEVEPNTVDAGGIDEAHPDGFMLGQELGIDSGEVKRHRAFYIIDRSLPVAFEPGENQNVDDAILLRRRIE